MVQIMVHYENMNILSFFTIHFTALIITYNIQIHDIIQCMPVYVCIFDIFSNSIDIYEFYSSFFLNTILKPLKMSSLKLSEN